MGSKLSRMEAGNRYGIYTHRKYVRLCAYEGENSFGIFQLLINE